MGFGAVDLSGLWGSVNAVAKSIEAYPPIADWIVGAG